jgi:hypothetical protein
MTRFGSGISLLMKSPIHFRVMSDRRDSFSG